MNWYPDWILEDTPTRQEEGTVVEEPSVVEHQSNPTEKVKERKKRPVVIPYVKGLPESTRSLLKSYDV